MKDGKKDEQQLKKNCDERLKVTGLIKNLFLMKKNTVFLFAMTQTVGNQLINIGKWMLGAQLKRVPKKKFNFFIENDKTKLLEFKLTQRINLNVLEHENNRVLLINLWPLIYRPDSKKNNEKSKSEDISKDVAKDIAEFLFALQVAKKNIGEAQALYYYAANAKNQQDKLNEEIKQAKKFISNQNIRLIMCDYDVEQQQSSPQQQIKKIYLTKKLNQFPFSFAQLFQQLQQKLNLSIFIKNQLRSLTDSKSPKKGETDIKVLVEGKFRDVQKQVTICLRELLSQVSLIIENIIKSKNAENTKIYQKQVEEIKILFTDMEIGTNYLKVIGYDKNDGQLAEMEFVLKVIEIKDHYEKEVKNKDIAYLKNFFKEIFTQLMKLPYNLSSDDINCLNSYALYLLEQNEIITQLLSIPPMYLSVFSILKLQSAKSKVAELIAETELKMKKNCKYYELFQAIIKRSQEFLNDGNHAKLDKLKQKIENHKKSIPVFKKLTLLNSEEQQSPKKIAQVIKQILQSYIKIQKNKDQTGKFNFGYLHQQFESTARRLQEFAFPELAIEIYKKLKFINKIDECVKEMIFKNRKLKQKEKENEKEKEKENYAVTTYSQISKYFYKIGMTQKAFEYAQLAYEHADNLKSIESFLTNMLDMKKKVMKNDIQQKEMELIQKIMTGKQNNNSYMDQLFTPEFKKNIGKIMQNIQCSGVDTTIKIRKEQISKFIS